MTMDQTNLANQVRPLVERLHRDLDRLSYYQLLSVGRTASTTAIQQAFYRRAVLLHPDRHFRLDDAELKAKINTVYKRISEAYRVLSTPPLRTLYDSRLLQGQLRLQQKDDESQS
ncbi:MAG: J domain-containing protein [Deltaproteobacteria bacterium]|nr:J domain-containing protein [Deltaproteobacteria bacterium]